MPAPTPEELGPLAGLAGTWEGSKGLDVSFHNADNEIGVTPYRERVTLAPFGPVDKLRESCSAFLPTVRRGPAVIDQKINRTRSK